jgi:Tfp pilus assembly protein PilO
MDLKDSKTQKAALGVLALFIVVYFWYTRLYTPTGEQIAQKSGEFETITTNLRNVELKAKSLEALQVEYKDLVDRYNQIENLLPEYQQIPSMLVQMHTASSLTGTRISEIKPLPLATENFYNIASFQITMSGTYDDFSSFIAYVANFPFIANVSQMNMEAQKISKGKAQPESEGGIKEDKKKQTVKAQFVLSTYYVKEEERLHELEM